MELNGNLDNDGDNFCDNNNFDDNVVDEGFLLIEDFNKVKNNDLSKKVGKRKHIEKENDLTRFYDSLNLYIKNT